MPRISFTSIAPLQFHSSSSLSNYRQTFAINFIMNLEMKFLNSQISHKFLPVTRIDPIESSPIWLQFFLIKKKKKKIDSARGRKKRRRLLPAITWWRHENKNYARTRLANAKASWRPLKRNCSPQPRKHLVCPPFSRS